MLVPLIFPYIYFLDKPLYFPAQLLHIEAVESMAFHRIHPKDKNNF